VGNRSSNDQALSAASILADLKRQGFGISRLSLYRRSEPKLAVAW
jgi:hypothetical protein